jgi:hypothetical protein
MKKLINITLLLVIFFVTVVFTACNQLSNQTSFETFEKTTVFNPNTTKVKLISVMVQPSRNARASSEEEVCEVEPLEAKEVELGSEHEYYFTDDEGNKIADLAQSDSGQYLPVYLELNEPKDGKEYLLLNQYKSDNLLEKFTRYKDDGTTYETYNLLLYEVVNADDLDAYKYNADTYIRIYPSANYWIDSKGYASNKIGTKITYDENFKNNFTPLSEPWAAWGWSTRNEEYDMWFCHRVVSYILHLDIEYTPVKLYNYYWWNPINIDEPINEYKIKKAWDANWYYQLKSIEASHIELTDELKTSIKKVTTSRENTCYTYCFLSRFSKSKEYLIVYKNENLIGTYLVELTLRDQQ